MFLTKLVSVLTVFLYLLVSSFANAENHTIDMLNKLGKEKMVYSEKVISIKINDEVTWKSVDKGHNVEFIGMPKGVSKFKSKISKDANFKFTKSFSIMFDISKPKFLLSFKEYFPESFKRFFLGFKFDFL